MAVHLPHLFIYLSPLELPDLFISSINYLTFSSTSLSLSPLELSDLFISPINCTPDFLFKSCARIFFLVSLWSLWFYYCLSLKGAFFPLCFLIGFAGFHVFIYLFIWFFCNAQIFFLAFGYQFYVECHLGAFGYQFYQFLYLVFLFCSIFVVSPRSFKLYVIVSKICIGP